MIHTLFKQTYLANKIIPHSLLSKTPSSSPGSPSTRPAPISDYLLLLLNLFISCMVCCFSWLILVCIKSRIWSAWSSDIGDDCNNSGLPFSSLLLSPSFLLQSCSSCLYGDEIIWECWGDAFGEASSIRVASMLDICYCFSNASDIFEKSTKPAAFLSSSFSCCNLRVSLRLGRSSLGSLAGSSSSYW